MPETPLLDVNYASIKLKKNLKNVEKIFVLELIRLHNSVLNIYDGLPAHSEDYVAPADFSKAARAL